jgi:SAM-dependent methyltransferase
MLEVNPDIALYCLDSWDTPNPADGFQNKDELFDQFIANMYKLECLGKIKVIRDESKNVMKYLEEGSFEAVYIDGSHLEEDVYRDFHNAYKLLKPGGFLLGDDWNWNSVSKGVMRAFWEINEEKEFLWPIRTTATTYYTHKISPVPEVFVENPGNTTS